MTSVEIKDLKGKQVRTMELKDSVFGIEPNTHVVHLALVRQLANARSGTACTKTRAEVRGGGRKPWRQKGTGRARAGSIRSPLWEGGGVIFGPRPRDYSLSMNKKSRRLALLSMLSARAADLVIVSDFNGLFSAEPKENEKVEQPKTKTMVAALQSLGVDGKKVLLILDRRQAGAPQVERAARNLPKVTIVDFTNLNVKDLAYCDVIVTSEQVIQEIEKRFQGRADKSVSAKEVSTAESTESTAAKGKSKKAAADSESDQSAATPARKSQTTGSVRKSPPAEPEAEAGSAPAKKGSKKSTEPAADAPAEQEDGEQKAPRARKKKSEDN